MRIRNPALCSILAVFGVFATGCATQPLYSPAADNVVATPQQVAATPEGYRGEVIWGGRIIAVNNLADHSEVEVFAYPLDAGQRPQVDDQGGGRFIAVLTGYADPLAYPERGMLTLHGRLDGVRSGRVGEAPYVFPLVRVDAAHVWTEKELRDRPRVQFGVGIGVGIH
jgi:outer membrane lipoprotein